MKFVAKLFSAFILTLVAVLCIFSVSPIYNFEEPSPFSGPDIFNPYAHVDSNVVWKRANFHTHTKVKGPLNECEFWPDEVWNCYDSLGFDILTFSNHNKLTAHPFDTALQVNVYEHGYSLYKYHKLVFGADRVRYFDHLLPVLASQKQWQLDYLACGSDFIQMNHPFRTGGTSEAVMQKLSGYQIMELDSGVSTEQEYWDWALSAGHYSFALANDDCHYPKKSNRIAVRSNWLDVPSGRYEDLKKVLLEGGYYCMRVPDYGNGDWEVKRAENAKLPQIKTIGLKDSTIYMSLTKPAQRIKLSGQGGEVLYEAYDADEICEVMHANQPYARITAYFDDGAVLYTNAFARYDKTKAPTPYRETGHSINIFLTILFNCALALLVALCIYLICTLFSHIEKKA